MTRLDRLLGLLALALVLALVAPGAAAQVTDQQARDCYAQRAGEVSALSSAGAWYGGWCPDGMGDWKSFTFAAAFGYRIEMPSTPASSPADLAVAYWRQNVKLPCTDVSIKALCDAAAVALASTRPLPPWIVRPNGSYTTRPMYDLVNGVRSKTASGTVNIKDSTGRPMACNYAVRVVEGSSVYAQIPNVEPVRVALCSKS